MLNYKSLEVTVKSKKQYVKVTYSAVEQNKERQMFNAEHSKKSDQPINKQLSDAWDRLIPMLMYGTTLVGHSIDLDENMDYDKYFREFEYNEDERFDGVNVTKAVFGGNANVESVKLYGYKLIEEFGKPFKVKFETPVIALDRHAENKFPLVVNLEEMCNDLQVLTKEWMAGATLSKAEVEALKEKEAGEPVDA